MFHLCTAVTVCNKVDRSTKMQLKHSIKNTTTTLPILSPQEKYCIHPWLTSHLNAGKATIILSILPLKKCTVSAPDWYHIWMLVMPMQYSLSSPLKKSTSSIPDSYHIWMQETPLSHFLTSPLKKSTVSTPEWYHIEMLGTLLQNFLSSPLKKSTASVLYWYYI